MGTPNYASKILAAASSTSVGIFTAAGIATLGTTDLDTARRIIVWGSSALGSTITVTGLSESRGPISETIATSTGVGTAVQTTQDFLRVTAISLSSAVSSTLGYLGTSSQGGTLWQVINTTVTPINLGFQLDITSPSTVVVASLEYSLDQPIYNIAANAWLGSSLNTGPRPTISSMGSSVTLDAVGNINFPIAAYRMTISSTSSSAGSAAFVALQAG
jgi:hypothetical protein